jgi:hypothetical protein
MLKLVLLSISALYVTTAGASNVMVTSSRFEVIFPKTDASSVVQSVHDAYSLLLNPGKKSVRFLPSPLPSSPDGPVQTMSNAGQISIPEMECPTAYAEFTFDREGVSSTFGRTGEVHRGCLYPFEQGFKLYGLVTSYKASSTGLGNSIVGGFTKLIKGSDEDVAEKMANWMIERLRKQDPDMLVAKVETPGKAVTEPDVELIKEKFPLALVSKPQIPAAASQPGSQLPFPLGMMYPNMPFKPSKPAVTGPQDEMLDARKNLTSMGLTYHDQTQFMSAVMRGDSLAVEMFIKAGGVDVDVRDKDGLKPLDLAIQGQKTKLALLLLNARLKVLRDEKGTDAVAAIPAPKRGTLAEMRDYLNKVESLPNASPAS